MNEKVRNKNVLATQIYTMVMFTSEQNVYFITKYAGIRDYGLHHSFS